MVSNRSTGKDHCCMIIRGTDATCYIYDTHCAPPQQQAQIKRDIARLYRNHVMRQRTKYKE